jgi:hypothetical protein
MHPVLERLHSEIHTAIGDLDVGQMQLRPAEDFAKWSIQQVIEHLLLTYGSSSDVFQARLAKGSPTKVRPTLRQRTGQLLVTRCGYFPTGGSAPLFVTPSNNAAAVDGKSLERRVSDALIRFDALAGEVEALYGGGRSISHKVLGPMSPLQWRRFHLRHGRHHLKRILAIRTANGLQLNGQASAE